MYCLNSIDSVLIILGHCYKDTYFWDHSIFIPESCAIAWIICCFVLSSGICCTVVVDGWTTGVLTVEAAMGSTGTLKAIYTNGYINK